jgi:hypothetical protein
LPRQQGFLTLEDMNAEQIRALPAGPKLDRLVAERVMGGRVHLVSSGARGDRGTLYEHTSNEGGGGDRPLPHYSSDLAAAWQLVDALSARGARLVLEDWSGLVPAWAALFTLADGHDTGQWAAPSAAEAICRAALAAEPRRAPPQA